MGRLLSVAWLGVYSVALTLSEAAEPWSTAWFSG